MVLIIDTDKPESLGALKKVMTPILREFKQEVIREVKELSKSGEQEEEVMITEEVMAKYRIDNHGTLQRYHREGLPVMPGRPNRYFRSDIENFLKTKKRINYD